MTGGLNPVGPTISFSESVSFGTSVAFGSAIGTGRETGTAAVMGGGLGVGDGSRDVSVFVGLELGFSASHTLSKAVSTCALGVPYFSLEAVITSCRRLA